MENFQIIKDFITEKNEIFSNLRLILGEFIEKLQETLDFNEKIIFVEDKDYKITIHINSKYNNDELFQFELFYDKNYFTFKNLKFKQQAKRFNLNDDYIFELKSFIENKIIQNKKWQSYFYLLRKSYLIEYSMTYDFTQDDEEEKTNKNEVKELINQ